MARTKNLLAGYTYANYQSQLGQKVHDCSGLVLGALICESYDSPAPDPPPSPISHSATAQYNSCSPKGSMATFPKIPGTLVFRTNGKYKKHVGIYIGKFVSLEGKEYQEAVVDARGHDSGVVVSELKDYKSWDCWGQLSICTKDTSSDTHFDASAIVSPPPQSTATMTPSLDIQTDKLTPYIATILAGHNPKVNYKKLKKAQVSGMMFYAGSLFDPDHSKKSAYVNGCLDSQVKQCREGGLPFALYVKVRARNVIEADAECRALYYVVSHYPPALGLWLALDTGATIKSVNDDILEVYYRYLYKWGLGAKCGLYVTQKQLDTITWDSFKDRFYLWMISSMEVSEIEDKLLQPEMFEVDD